MKYKNLEEINKDLVKHRKPKEYGKCPECNEPLIRWFVYDNLSSYIGCSNLKCNYKEV